MKTTFSKTSKAENPLQAMQPGEQVLFDIKRHPIGLLGTNLVLGFGIVLMTVLAIYLNQQVASSANATQIQHYLWGGYALIAAIFILILFLSTIVYWGNRWILTSDSITQVLQHSLFNKEMAQLSLGNLEDVTAEQNGIMAHIFNYGSIKVETAGEREKFVFVYCPNPNRYAQMVLQAREAFEQQVREVGGASRSPYLNNIPQGQGQPPQTTASSQVPTDDDLH